MSSDLSPNDKIFLALGVVEKGNFESKRRLNDTSNNQDAYFLGVLMNEYEQQPRTQGLISKSPRVIQRTSLDYNPWIKYPFKQMVRPEHEKKQETQRYVDPSTRLIENTARATAQMQELIVKSEEKPRPKLKQPSPQGKLASLEPVQAMNPPISMCLGVVADNCMEREVSNYIRRRAYLIAQLQHQKRGAASVAAEGGFSSSSFAKTAATTAVQGVELNFASTASDNLLSRILNNSRSRNELEHGDDENYPESLHQTSYASSLNGDEEHFSQDGSHKISINGNISHPIIVESPNADVNVDSRADSVTLALQKVLNTAQNRLEERLFGRVSSSTQTRRLVVPKSSMDDESGSATPTVIPRRIRRHTIYQRSSVL